MMLIPRTTTKSHHTTTCHFLREKMTVLILTRKLNERIVINDDITVHILGVSGKQVRIGIDAPSHIGVYRRELYQKIQANTQPTSAISGQGMQEAGRKGLRPLGQNNASNINTDKDL